MVALCVQKTTTNLSTLCHVRAIHFIITIANTLANHIAAGTNYNGVRIRVSKLRVEQRKRFEELGWKMPDSDKASATSRKKEPATPRKKRDTVEAVGEEDEVEKPKKKPRVKKGKKAEQEQEQEVLDKVEVEGEVSVKEENIKEEMNA